MPEEIVCPECGGNLVFWKEYIVTRTQAISKKGILHKTVKQTRPIEFNCCDMHGFKCTKCGWMVNTCNEIEKCNKYKNLCEWVDEHGDELRLSFPEECKSKLKEKVRK